MKTFAVKTFNNLCKITVADAHMISNDLIMNATNTPYHYIHTCALNITTKIKRQVARRAESEG